MDRREFITASALIGAGVAISGFDVLKSNPPKAFDSLRPAFDKRSIKSKALDLFIAKTKKKIVDIEIAWLFENCYPNTLDTTITFTPGSRPKTYVITGDIDAMWLRDSAAQVWPYLRIIKDVPELKPIILGVINQQAEFISLDPYANAFYNNPEKESHWKDDHTKMQKGIHERKWELDSLAYHLWLCAGYYKATGDASFVTPEWRHTLEVIFKTLAEQMQSDTSDYYLFRRNGLNPKDTQAGRRGEGLPVKPIGLVASAFRPSDDATVFKYLIPSNLMLKAALEQLGDVLLTGAGLAADAAKCRTLAQQISDAVTKHAIIDHPTEGKIFAFEIDGFGSRLLIDDPNAPSLLSLPYYGATTTHNEIYINTRRFVLSPNNPYYYKGTAAEGLTSAHTPPNNIWPLSIIMRGLTTTDPDELNLCFQMLKNTHGSTGFMHESFDANDPAKFTRAWFAWANGLFGELVLHTLDVAPKVLTQKVKR